MADTGRTMKALVDIGEKPEDCWSWLGSINKKTGYGKKQLNGKTLLAHRWVYEMLRGPIPRGMVINHKCRNTKCVNPHHLEVVTQAENCRHGNGSKLNIDQAREIKEAKSSRRWGDGRRLAERYGVTSALIHDIWNGRAWKDA